MSRRIEPHRLPYLMRGVGPVLRREMLKDDGAGPYQRDSCIAASRLGMDFLNALGVPSEALRVECMVISPALANRYRKEGRLPSGPEERERWATETGGHSVGLGFPQDSGKPGLHVVLFVDKRFIWDLSLDQASRPLRGLIIPGPLVVDLADGPPGAKAWRKGEPWMRSRTDGFYINYRVARDRFEDWRQSNNWRRDGGDAPARAALVDALLRGYSDAVQEHVTTL